VLNLLHKFCLSFIYIGKFDSVVVNPNARDSRQSFTFLGSLGSVGAMLFFYSVAQGAKESRALSVVPGIIADVNALKFADVNEICKKLVN
jgi:hypothetical protein